MFWLEPVRYCEAGLELIQETSSGRVHPGQSITESTYHACTHARLPWGKGRKTPAEILTMTFMTFSLGGHSLNGCNTMQPKLLQFFKIRWTKRDSEHLGGKVYNNCPFWLLKTLFCEYFLSFFNLLFQILSIYCFTSYTFLHSTTTVHFQVTPEVLLFSARTPASGHLQYQCNIFPN